MYLIGIRDSGVSSVASLLSSHCRFPLSFVHSNRLYPCSLYRLPSDMSCLVNGFMVTASNDSLVVCGMPGYCGVFSTSIVHVPSVMQWDLIVFALLITVVLGLGSCIRSLASGRMTVTCAPVSTNIDSTILSQICVPSPRSDFVVSVV